MTTQIAGMEEQAAEMMAATIGARYDFYDKLLINGSTQDGIMVLRDALRQGCGLVGAYDHDPEAVERLGYADRVFLAVVPDKVTGEPELYVCEQIWSAFHLPYSAAETFCRGHGVAAPNGDLILLRRHSGLLFYFELCEAQEHSYVPDMNLDVLKIR